MIVTTPSGPIRMNAPSDAGSVAPPIFPSADPSVSRRFFEIDGAVDARLRSQPTYSPPMPKLHSLGVDPCSFRAHT
jgi:hypothetical protein